MPSPGELTQRTADALGVSFGTVSKVGRELRDEGLLTTGARGVNAPDMLILDAASYLTIFLSTDKPSEAVECLRDFGGLSTAVAKETGVHPDFTLTRAGLGEAHTFLQGLCGLIEMFARDGGEAYFQSAVGAGRTFPLCNVSVEPASQLARIELPGVDYLYTVDVSDAFEGFSLVDSVSHVRDDQAYWSISERLMHLQGRYSRGLRVTREIDENVIASIAELFAPSPAKTGEPL